MEDSRDNPFWAALSGAQSHLAKGAAPVLRYAADVAPFVAIAPDVDPGGVSDAIHALVAPGESVVFVGRLPRLDGRFVEEARAQVLQMDHAPASVERPAERFEELSLDDAPVMLALTGLVYPGYFRARTPVMGRYYGLRAADGSLAAMAGERMRTRTHVEISGVCTHPDHVGRGHAGRLVRHAVGQILDRGERAFLHVSPENTRAVRLYEALGFGTVRVLDLLRARAR